MENKQTDTVKKPHKTMTIDGRKVVLSFAQDHNQNISPLIRSTLIDAYIRSNSIFPYEAQA